MNWTMLSDIFFYASNIEGITCFASFSQGQRVPIFSLECFYRCPLPVNKTIIYQGNVREESRVCLSRNFVCLLFYVRVYICPSQYYF